MEQTVALNKEHSKRFFAVVNGKISSSSPRDTEVYRTLG